MSIARITGISGSLIWTGDRGQIVRDVKIGTELAGGTIEGMAPDSWFKLQFNDGSTVMISGTSMLTFADLGQKRLRLREGRLSANVTPQRVGKPMLIHTRSAVLEVLGTQFDVEANLASTVLNVSEGKVRLRRLSDGSVVDVPAKHHVTTDTDDDLLSVLVPDSVHAWKSQLHLKPESYGKWRPATEQNAGVGEGHPINPAGVSARHPVSGGPFRPPFGWFARRCAARLEIVVSGRLRSATNVHFGIRVMYPNGEFAGMFRGDLHQKQPLAAVDGGGRFVEFYDLRQFTIDPAVYDRRDELAASPDGLVLDGVWAFHTQRRTFRT